MYCTSKGRFTSGSTTREATFAGGGTHLAVTFKLPITRVFQPSVASRPRSDPQALVPNLHIRTLYTSESSFPSVPDNLRPPGP